MENIEAKADFLLNGYASCLQQLSADADRKWGKMNVQQMIEHMSDYVTIANGKTPMQLITTEENLPRMQAFLSSEKPFRENTPNALMSDTPAALRNATKEQAIEELQAEIDDFFAFFKQNEGAELMNPFFGSLNFEYQVQLLHKHATHHLRQFGVEI